MGAKKPRIVIIGAGMAGLTAANKLYAGGCSMGVFELMVVEGGSRIGGRINTSKFGGNRVEMGATWIHGIGGSPVHGIAREVEALRSEQPWECMDGFMDEPVTMAEGGREVSPCVLEPISNLFRVLMSFAGKSSKFRPNSEEKEYYDIAAKALEVCEHVNGGLDKMSIGSFLRKGLEIYWEKNRSKDEGIRAMEEATFAILENTQRTYTSAGDLSKLDFKAESEYRMFPGEEITIARGYSSVIEYLASALPWGTIELGRKVHRIDWNLQDPQSSGNLGNGHYDSHRPVKIYFSDGSVTLADHVIVTVSLGVLKAGISGSQGMFDPPLPDFKQEAISRLGFGAVNKLFLQLDHCPGQHFEKFPSLQMAFHPWDSELRHRKVPQWMRRTASLCPIHKNSDIVLSWFAGEEALELEKLTDQEVIDGVSTTVSCLLPKPEPKASSKESCNGSGPSSIKFTKVLRSKWGSDPLFLGSYSYVQVGSSGVDLDALAEPLPRPGHGKCEPGLQILFAGEATHRTHYSTTHGAYFSGLREANRLLKHYNCC